MVDVGVVVNLQLPERDQSEEEDGEEGEQGVGEALVPGGGELREQKTLWIERQRQ